VNIYKRLGRLVHGFEKPERIYVSISDHKACYEYHTAQWEVKAGPYGLNRDQLRFEGIPIEWVPGYNGPPTIKEPERKLSVGKV